MKKIILLLISTLALEFGANAQTNMIGGHECVDLGLPSGTLWATCNVGSDTPEGYGDHFAWGETIPKDYYDWNTYKWSNGSYDQLTKYCTDRQYGYNFFFDGKHELDREDDAAFVNWGPAWCMPTLVQQQELIDNCTWTWMTQNGVNGRLATGPNGNSIFLPAAGYRLWGNLKDIDGLYWSSTLDSIGYYTSLAYNLEFDSDELNWSSSYRFYGLTVRAVVNSNELQTATPVISGCKDEGLDAYKVEITCTETATIYYRVKFVGGEFGEWAEYTDSILFTETGSYYLEAYAEAAGKLPSETAYHEFIIEQSLVNGIDEVVNCKNVAAVRYYNVCGQQVQQPSGLTIMVTTYTDGTTSPVKVMK